MLRPYQEQRSLHGRAGFAARLAFVLLLPCPGWHSPNASAGAIASSDPIFKAHLIDGKSVLGRVASLGPGSIKLASADGTAHEVAINRLIKLTREFPIAVTPPDASQMILPDGDRLMKISIDSSTEKGLQIQSDVLGKLSVPLDAILGLIFSSRPQNTDLDALWEQVRTEPRASEIIRLANGDRLTGGFLGMDESKIKIQVAGKPTSVDRAEVLSLGFDPKLVNYPRPKSDFLDVTLKDGSRLGITEARLDEAAILATTRFGASIKISISDLIDVHAMSPSVVYLSDRKPIRHQYLPYIGPTREFRVDRTVEGHLFQLGGQVYDRGVGTQSTTFLVYRIESGDRRFQALVGVDERAGPLGSVVFRVLVDGKERFKTPPMTDHNAPRPVDVDLTGGKYFVLVTEFGDRGDVRDLADWVESRVIR